MTIVLGVLAFYWVRTRILASVEEGIRSFLLVLGGIVAFLRWFAGRARDRSPREPLSGGTRSTCDHAARTRCGGYPRRRLDGRPRLLQATSREYAQLGVRRSIAALVPGFVIAQLAIALGIPISLNNIILSGSSAADWPQARRASHGERSRSRSPSGCSPRQFDRRRLRALSVARDGSRRLTSVDSRRRWRRNRRAIPPGRADSSRRQRGSRRRRRTGRPAARRAPAPYRR